MGRDAKPLPPNTEKKFRRVAREFAKHRKSDLVETVTAREANDWMRKMQEVGELSNRTIAQRIQNLKTLIEWARGQALGDVFPSGNPLDVLKAPKGAPVPLGERTLRIEEARAILRAARGEAKPELRWLPWLMAYSGARVNEVAQLRADDFFQVGNDWFYRLTTKGGRKLKNQHSARRVPVHPDLIAEGLLAFTGAAKAGERLFPERSQANLRDWVRKSVGLKREALAPNHGWRHLFEDMALTAQMQEAAKRYITGRASRGSDDDYGKSDAMLPALAVEMRKLPPFLEG
ncbi:Site-specific recombinase, phage integrase family [Rhodovulum sp. P5]|nr:Site-specific recombinase, phage integrase family [Rhodovulum sp. P5]